METMLDEPEAATAGADEGLQSQSADSDGSAGDDDGPIPFESVLSLESQEIMASGSDTDDDAAAAAATAAADTDGDKNEAASATVPAENVRPGRFGQGHPIRRESRRTVSSDAFPMQAKSIAKTIKPRASFRLLVEVREGQFIWWEFATAHRDIGFAVEFHYPCPEVKYNTEDALIEGMLTQVEVFQDHCTERKVAVTQPGLLRYLNTIFGEEPTRTHMPRILEYVAELQNGRPILEKARPPRGRKNKKQDPCDLLARALLNDRSSKLVMVPMARQTSHLMVQYGFVQAPATGQISLAWDNSYSRVRSKELTLHYEVAEGDQPPARWAQGPLTVPGSGAGQRGNLITSGGTSYSGTKKNPNVFNMVKGFLEQRRRKDSEEETLFFTRPTEHVGTTLDTVNEARREEGAADATTTTTSSPQKKTSHHHHLDIGRSSPSPRSEDEDLRNVPLQRITSSGQLPRSPATPRVIASGARADANGSSSSNSSSSSSRTSGNDHRESGHGLHKLEDSGLLSVSRPRGGTEVGFV